MATKLALARRLKKNLSELLESSTSSVPRSDYETLFADLNGTLEEYLDPQSISDIFKATIFGANAHKGQKRKSGEDFIYHPMAVAKILGEMRMDSRTIIAAILHDVIEDTDTSLKRLEKKFGREIAHLVNGVSKVNHLEEQTSRKHAEAVSFGKMFVATADDIRVIIIKLADRLHNMTTLDSLDRDRQNRIARQTLEIYAPVAYRLGMYDLALKLEDLGFQRLYPWRHKTLGRAVQTTSSARKKMVRRASKQIADALANDDIEVSIVSKSLYYIYRTMEKSGITLHDIKDIYSIRIITRTRQQCYESIGVAHEVFRPLPGNFKDFIAIPKTNGYQSLHTMIVGPNGQAIEIQVQTRAMHIIAKSGVASLNMPDEILNEEGLPTKHLAHEWVSSIVESHELSSTSGEFMEHLKTALFPDEVYVFTPKGDIKRLPVDATALDFAYSVHTDIGNESIGAIVNDQPVPLHEVLNNGDRIEIKTRKPANPNISWLDFVTTSRAKTAIRHHFNIQRKQQALQFGKKLLFTALHNVGYTRRISETEKNRLLKELKIDTWNQLLSDIGSGSRLPLLVARQLADLSSENIEALDSATTTNLTIEGTENLVVTHSKCCYPVPGDKIYGIYYPGKGLVVHRNQCSNTNVRTQPLENCVHLNWSKDIIGCYEASLIAEIADEPGMLWKVAGIIANHDSNINGITMNAEPFGTARLSILLLVRNNQHLAKIIRDLESTSTVYKVYRP
ncbi:MAG: RelA/SpoT family protein [Gammaproteobacteria bacterium]|nr:RelA/SpoT family protein [Gammaproteobacteria bacterium]MCY4275078.1 RelA/SpoT family protein [Gammaproteobacteria bacterium]